MPSLKVAVIGAGGGQGGAWTKRVKSWKKLCGYDLELVALCDRLESPLKTRAEEINAKAYLDYNEMFEKEELDLVIIPTPHYMHAPMSIAAAEHNVNVLTEKIMCINLAQADAMKAAVDKSGIKLGVGFQHRFDPKYNIIKGLIDSGDLGDIFQVNMSHHWWRTEDYYLNSTPVPENEDDDNWEGWRGHWKTEGAGALANQIIHFIDLFQWFVPGNLKSISAMSRVSKHTLTETDDNTNAVCDFDSGCLGQIQAGVAYEYGKIERFEVFGTEGAIRQQDKGLKKAFGIPTQFVDMRNPAVKKSKRLLSYGNGIVLDSNKKMLENLINAIKTDDASTISVDVNEGRKSVELIRGMLLSHKLGKRLDAPFDDNGDFPELMHTYVDPRFKDMM